MIQTWEDGVIETIERCQLAPSSSGAFNLDASYRDMYEMGAWNQIARKAWVELEVHAQENWSPNPPPLTPAEFAKFLAGKQHDYGTENIRKFGHRGLEVRLWDKVARLENLRKRRSQVPLPQDSGIYMIPTLNEPTADTYVDMIGYVIIDNMLVTGDFLLPLKGDIAQEAA